MVKVFSVLILVSSCTHHVDERPDAMVDALPDSSGSPVAAWSLPATVHVTAAPSLLAAWNAEVTWDVNDFNFALTAYACPPPFQVVAPTVAADHEIVLVAASAELEPGLLGGESATAITIRGTPASNPQTSPLRGTIAHELGHAIGLPHADPSLGLSAMTVPPDTQLRSRDVAAVACLLGCGPC